MSYLLRITPERNFDVHVLRTFTRDLNAWIVRLQTTSPHASDTISQVIYALNHTFRDVELSYLVWRNERVQTVLQHGFQYARARIQAALWRRERGRPAATFPAIYPAFQFAGAVNPSPERQSRPLPPAQQDGGYFQANTYGGSPPGTSPTWGSPPAPPPAQQYPIQNTHYPNPPRRNDASTQTGALTGFTGFGQEAGAGRVNVNVNVNDYPPPPYPPANWKPPDPVPGSPPVPAAAAGAVEVAIRYLEAVNKAINICIDLDAM